MQEKEVEKAFTDEGKKHLAIVLKFTSPGTAGVPDRIVLRPFGKVRFVELKAPGKKPRVLQRKVFELFAAFGHPVDVIDNAVDAKGWWAKI